MLEKALIFGRDNGIGQNLRQILKADHAPFFAGAIE